jgi:hypothetical protein
MTVFTTALHLYLSEPHESSLRNFTYSFKIHFSINLEIKSTSTKWCFSFRIFNEDSHLILCKTLRGTIPVSDPAPYYHRMGPPWVVAEENVFTIWKVAANKQPRTTDKG